MPLTDLPESKGCRWEKETESAGKVAGYGDQHCVYQDLLADAFCPNGTAPERRKANIWPAVRSERSVKKVSTLLHDARNHTFRASRSLQIVYLQTMK